MATVTMTLNHGDLPTKEQLEEIKRNIKETHKVYR